MLTSEIRKKFLDYFKGNNHKIIESSSLVPGNDETLLFTNAGMVQFKDVFLGTDQRAYKRATTAQRCIRAGGKHNDLENVGYTLRHHTFFEMLGNFSFGDYFKKEAIQLAWNFLTEELNLEKERLWVSVFESDDEAAKIWSSEIGIPTDRIIKLGEEDNFWSMGDVGPCGPCSEIYYDHGEEYSGTPPGSPGNDGDRFVEIWNLVFMEFNRDADGKLNPLPKPSVDTGMGLERMAAVMQGVASNYDTDIFLNLIKASEKLIKSPGASSHQVIADHIRSVSFLIADGVIPSNEGRGYVLRRIMRRAIRDGYKLGVTKPFMHKLVKPLIKDMGSAYTMLSKKEKFITQSILDEENKFLETLDKGIRILDKEIKQLKKKIIPGKLVFKLHDTYGFPYDLTADIAREKDLKLDKKGFEKSMDQQVQKSKSSSQFKVSQMDLSKMKETKFLGYERLHANAKVLGLWQDNKLVNEAKPSSEYFIVVNQSPFYAESGGQIGDQGKFANSKAKGNVVDCIKEGKVFLHKIIVKEGQLAVGDKLKLEVNASHRYSAAAHHSATHLMHAALKHVLGDHVEQKGSLVDATKLRFDFSHPKALSEDEIQEVESIVNQHIFANSEVHTSMMKLDEAIQSGAEAMFGEKYDDEVRVLSMSNAFSVELCGGTHVKQTGDIGYFIILNESSVSSGVRRIEACVGNQSIKFIANMKSQLQTILGLLNVGGAEVESKIKHLISENKSLKKGNQSNDHELKIVHQSISQINDFELVLIETNSTNIQDLRKLVDQQKLDQKKKCILVYGLQNTKVTLVCGSTDDIQESIKANEVISLICKSIDGKGGGRVDFAQGAGTSKDMDEFVTSVTNIVQSLA